MALSLIPAKHKLFDYVDDEFQVIDVSPPSHHVFDEAGKKCNLIGVQRRTAARRRVQVVLEQF